MRPKNPPEGGFFMKRGAQGVVENALANALAPKLQVSRRRSRAGSDARQGKFEGTHRTLAAKWLCRKR